MADRVISQLDFQDADIEEFFRKGLRLDDEPQHPDRLTDAIMQRGAYLAYAEIPSNEDAAVLRRMLSTGAPVRTLDIGRIALGAFKVAFDSLQECPLLERIIIDDIHCEGADLGLNSRDAFRSLRTLCLHCKNVGGGFANDISSYIRENKFLKELRLAYSFGGDEGAAAIVEALTVNATLKKFTLSNWGLRLARVFGDEEPKLSSKTFLDVVKLLASNSVLELVDISTVCPLEKDVVSPMLADERYVNAFRRLKLEWPDALLPDLTALIRKEACYPELYVRLNSAVDKGVLREFFDAVVTNQTLLGLHFSEALAEDLDDPFAGPLNSLGYGIASVLKRTQTLRTISFDARPCEVASVFDALKENRSVTKATLRVEMVSGEMAKSLSELLAVNQTLEAVAFANYWESLPKEIEDVVQALRTNYSLTDLDHGCQLEECEKTAAIHEMEALLKRNDRLVRKAAEFVISGADVSDEGGVDALKKVRSKLGLVRRVQALAGLTEEAALKQIQSALECLSA